MKRKTGMSPFFIGCLILMIIILMTIILIKPAGAIQDNEGTFCDSGKTFYCWISYPYWRCLSYIGGLRCADPIKN